MNVRPDLLNGVWAMNWRHALIRVPAGACRARRLGGAEPERWTQRLEFAGQVGIVLASGHAVGLTRFRDFLDWEV